MVAAVVNLEPNFDNTVAQFQESSAGTRLSVLRYLTKRISGIAGTEVPSAFFSQRVQKLLKEIQQIPKEDRYEAVLDMLSGTPTRLAEAYKNLDTNMKVAFWYRLTSDRSGNMILPKMQSAETNGEQEDLMTDIEKFDFDSLVFFLNQAIQEQAQTSGMSIK